MGGRTWRTVAVVLGVGLALALVGARRTFAGGDRGREHEDWGDFDWRAVQGLRIAPVPLDLAGKNRLKVGLGSYLVNAVASCNDCHTWPNYAPGHDPFAGQPEQVNAARYLAGGRPFGPTIVSRNITPDAQGRPAGLTEDEFIQVIRTGHDPVDGGLLQVMPWPVLRHMLDRDLEAIYVYLTAIPPLGNPPTPLP